MKTITNKIIKKKIIIVRKKAKIIKSREKDIS